MEDGRCIVRDAHALGDMRSELVEIQVEHQVCARGKGLV